MATDANTNTTQDYAAEDSSPALAQVDPEFNPDDTTGLDVETFPGMRDLRRMLPAQRIKSQTDLAKVQDMLPESFTSQGFGQQDVTSMSSEDLDKLAGLFEAIQETVLENAVDRDDMEAWLIDQDEPIKAVLYGFNQYQAALGN